MILCLWLCAVLLLQKLPLAVLGSVLACACLLGGRPATKAWFGLLRRSRWILIVLVSTFVLMTPGESVWPGAPMTFEGVGLALDHAGRLVAVLFAVAWLVAGRSSDELVSALWGLARAARARLLESAVVRLALTLRFAAADERRHKNWKEMLGTADDVGTIAPIIRFEIRPLEARDLAWCTAAFLTTAGLWWKLP